MTHDEIKNKINILLQNINKTIYPEIWETLNYYLDFDDLTDWEYQITAEIFDSDQTSALPEIVTEFLMDLYNELIKDGCFDAACDLGSLYYKGRFGKIDYTKAVEYYNLAAKNGCRQAQENLGYCYYYGRNVEVDYKKAFHYFALGAFDGHINSLYKIGDMYRNGYYVDKNPTEAYNIYKRCLETLTEEAIPLVGADVMLRMGDCCFEGIGTEVDLNEAYKMYYNAEVLYYDRLTKGDFLIKGCYEKVIKRQEEIRAQRNKEIPNYDWVK